MGGVRTREIVVGVVFVVLAPVKFGIMETGGKPDSRAERVKKRVKIHINIHIHIHIGIHIHIHIAAS